MTRVPTEAQREAIEAERGPVLVIAGPGAGKTFCLTARVEHHILRHGIPPERILAVTFTNKAAQEIVDRLAGRVTGLAAGIGGTLHSLCLRLLREYAAEAGLPPGFGVADEEYQRALLRSFGAREEAIGDWLRLFGIARHDPAAMTERLQRVWDRYRGTLRRRGLLDFDDLIVETAGLFEAREDVAAAIAGRWDAILLDEFQDLTPTHYAILSRLARDHRTIFGVGDDEQSIYGFTGAAPGILKRFEREFEVTPILLDRNHRNSEAIFAAARAVLRPDTPLFEKPLRATRAGGVSPVLREFEDEREEARWLVEDLLRDRAGSGLPWGEYAILSRANWLLETLEGSLLGAGIPFRTSRGRALTDDPVVGPVLAALRLIRNPSDPVPVSLLIRAFLRRDLQEQVRAIETRGPLSALAAFAAQGESAAEQDLRRVRRLYHHITNLPALARSVETLGELVDLIVEDRPGSRPSAFEEHADQLTDPADLPAARRLADDLARARKEGRRVHLVPCRGIEVALAGMLRAAGLERLLKGAGEGPGPDDLVLDLPHAPGMPLRLFKSLQLLRAPDPGGLFERCVVFDLETTGLDRDQCGIVEIGAVRIRDGAVVDRFHVLVDPGQPIEPAATEVHGYRDADVAGSDRFGAVWPRFEAFIGGDLLVAHNGREFDIPVLYRHIRDAGGDTSGLCCLDTLPLARSVTTERARLEDLAARFEVPLARAHHALDDAEALAGVLPRLVEARAARQRLTAFPGGLDWLALGLVLESGDPDSRSTEEAMILGFARFYALSPYSSCLARYAEDRAGLEQDTDWPPVTEVIERLGGERLRRRLERKKATAARYPSSVVRLERLLENVGELPVEEGVDRVLEMVALAKQDGTETAERAVSLLTMHATKGLEFSRVYIVGMEDGQMPGWRALRGGTRDEFPEARRVLYVGMTRARDRLVLTRCRRRSGRDTGGTVLLEGTAGLIDQQRMVNAGAA